MPDLVFDCIHCGHGLVVDAKAGGGMVNCPECSGQIVIPRAQVGLDLAGKSAKDQIGVIQAELISLNEQIGEADAKFKDLERRFPEQRDKLDAFLSDAVSMKEKVKRLQNQPRPFAVSQNDGSALPRLETPPFGNRSAWGLVLAASLIVSFVSAVVLMQPPNQSNKHRPAVPNDIRFQIDSRGSDTIEDPTTRVTVHTRGLPARNEELVVLRFEIENLTQKQTRRIHHLIDRMSVLDAYGQDLPVRVVTDLKQATLDPGKTCSVDLWLSKDDRKSLDQVRWLPGVWKSPHGVADHWVPLFDQPFLVKL